MGESCGHAPEARVRHYAHRGLARPRTAITKLTLVVLPPAVREARCGDAAGMRAARAERGEREPAADGVRDASLDPPARHRAGSLVVGTGVPPAVRRSFGRERTRERRARADGRELERGRHAYRLQTRAARPRAELPVVVAAPAERGAVAAQRA